MTACVHTPKDETPTADQASGVSREQAEMFDQPLFCPLLPPKSSTTEQVLFALMTRDLTQFEWLMAGNGWRLAAGEWSRDSPVMPSTTSWLKVLLLPHVPSEITAWE